MTKKQYCNFLTNLVLTWTHNSLNFTILSNRPPQASLTVYLVLHLRLNACAIVQGGGRFLGSHLDNKAPASMTVMIYTISLCNHNICWMMLNVQCQRKLIRHDALKTHPAPADINFLIYATALKLVHNFCTFFPA